MHAPEKNWPENNWPEKNRPEKNWFVEEFHLASPVEEFETFSRQEIDRLRSANPSLNDTAHRQAVDLVLRKLRDNGHGGVS